MKRKWNVYRKYKDERGASNRNDVSLWDILKIILFNNNTKEYIEIRTGD